jgi:benzoate-CoA ligase family protein
MGERWNACEWLLDRHVEAGDGAREALRVGGISSSYAELLDRTRSTAAGLRAAGVGPGDRVGLVLLDSPEFTTAFLACLRIGAVAVPVNPLLPWRDVGVIVGAAGATVVLVSAERSTGREDLAELAPSARAVITGTDEWTDLTGGQGHDAPHPTDPGSAGFWLCTSGSTGRPKLAMHRHGDLKVTADRYARGVLGTTAADRFYSVGPMFHAYGLGNSITFPMAVGATAILEPTRPPTPGRVADIARTEAPTLFFAIPTFYAALNASDIADDAFASVRLGVSAAEALPAETWHRFRERFDVEILDGIGSTEMTHIFLSNHQGRVRPGTTGTVVDGYDVRIVDDEGVDRADGTPGHLWVRGDSAAIGYFGDDAATRRTFGLGDGWIRTGDTYVRDAQGCHTYLGRSDDMLRVGGEWVAPAEVEATIIEHPSVLEVAVVGEVDDRGITRPTAYVVAKEGFSVTQEDVIAHCRGRLAGYKRPSRVVLMPSLPKTATGKIQRFKLRADAGVHRD